MLEGSILVGGIAATPPLALVAAAVAAPDEPTRAADPRLRLSLLKALAAMAIRSKRRQADLAVALRRSGITQPREGIAAALIDLLDNGLIDDLILLSDGGLLLSVTSLGIERLHGAQPSLAAA